MWKIGGAIVGALVIGWFAFPAVRAQFLALAPFALIAICPLAMLFGMRGHGGHGGGSHGNHGGCCGDHEQREQKQRSIERDTQETSA